MQQLLIIVAIVAAFVFARWVMRQPPEKKLWWLLISIAVVFVVLFAAGRLHGLIAVAAAAVPILMRLFKLLRPVLPSLWSWFYRQQTQGTHQDRQRAHPTSSNMDAAQAYQILGLQAGCSRQEIITAHRRLIQKAHPDHGGSPHLASLINQARDYLLKGSHTA